MVAGIHFVPDDILTSLQVLGNGKGVDSVVSKEGIRGSPYARRVLSHLMDLEPYSTVGGLGSLYCTGDEKKHIRSPRIPLCDIRRSPSHVGDHGPLVTIGPSRPV